MDLEESVGRIVKVLMFAVFLTPLILGPFGLNMSEYPKAVFFRLLIEIIFLFYVFLVLLNKKYLPQKSFLLFSVILFDAILIISSLLGINFYSSFFGDMSRGEGIILHLHLLVYFIVLLGLFKNKEDWMQLMRATVVVSGITSIAGILQLKNISWFYNVEIARLSGTFSNPDFFGAYLTLSIFLALFLFFAEPKRNWKIFWAGLMALNFLTLILSGTRAAWIGLAAGIAVICVLNYQNLSYKNKIYSLFVVLAICVLVFLCPFIIDKLNLQNSNLGQRILSVYNIDINNRVALWNPAFDAFKNRPVLGWGFESFSYVADKYFKTGYVGGIYFDRPHNKFLEILVNCGIIGMLNYLLIFFILFYLILKYSKLWNKYNNKHGILFGSVIFAFFVAGFVQNLFGFDQIGTYILFFLVAGFVNNNWSQYSSLRERSETTDEAIQSKFGKIILFAAVFIFTVFVMYQINIKPTMAALYFPESVRYEASDFSTALDGYKTAISQNTIYDYDLNMAYEDRSIFLLENYFGQNNGQKAVDGLLTIKPVLQKYIDQKYARPNNLREFIIRTDEWAYIVKKDPNYLVQMQKDINLAMEFNPNMSVFYQLQGEMEILQNNYSAGEKDIIKSCAMDVAGCNGNQSTAHKNIGIAYFKKGDNKSSILNFQKTLDIDYEARKKGLPSTISNPAPFINSVAMMYYEYLNDFQDCQNVYKMGIEAYPEYQNFFEQRLDIVTADYEHKK